jgi:hypothetical protein
MGLRWNMVVGCCSGSNGSDTDVIVFVGEKEKISLLIPKTPDKL